MDAINQMGRFTVLAVNDKKSFCECCGRQGLKKVVWIHDSTTDEEKHFGTSCAIQPSKGFGLSTEIKRAVRKHEDAIKRAWVIAHRLYRADGGTYTGNGKDGWKPDNAALLQAKFEEYRAAH